MSLRPIAYDTFTEAGTGLVVITSHTPEIGGAWTSVSNAGFVDADNDYATEGLGGTFGGISALLSAKSWQPDVTATVGWFGGTAAGRFGGLATRCINISNAYAALALSDGTTRLYRWTSAAFTQIASVAGTNTASRGARFHAIGSSPTTLRLRFWDASGAEPSTWDVNTTDNTAANQSAVPVGVGIYVETVGSSRASYTYVDNFSATETIGDLVIRRQAVTRASTW